MKSANWGWCTLAIGIFIGSFLIRYPYAGVYPESWDVVDFALALKDYDIAAMQPHFPGYPFFILFATLLNGWVHQPIYALSLVSVIAGVGSVVIFFQIAGRFLPGAWPIIATIWFAIHPLFWLLSVQPMSDSLGLFVLLLIIWVTSFSLDRIFVKEHGVILLWSSILYAILLGIRLSYWPVLFSLLFPLFCLFRTREPVPFLYRVRYVFLSFVLFFTVTLLWIWGVSFNEGGIQSFFHLGKYFLGGHFMDWGGTILTQSSVMDRFLIVGKLILSSIGGGPVEGESIGYVGAPIVMILFLLGLVSRFKMKDFYKVTFLLLWLVPTFIWIFFGQNVGKPRHLLPLIPVILLFVMIGTERITIKQKFRKVTWIGMGILLSSHYTLGWNLVHAYGSHKPPVVSMGQYIEQRYPLDRTLIIAWEEERVLRWINSSIQVERLRRWEHLLDTLRMHKQYTNLLLTKKALDGLGEKAKGLEVQKVRSFSGSWRLDPIYYDCSLYKLNTSTSSW